MYAVNRAQDATQQTKSHCVMLAKAYVYDEEQQGFMCPLLKIFNIRPLILSYHGN